MIHKITALISLTVCGAYLLYAAHCWRKVRQERDKSLAAWENLRKAAEKRYLEAMENTAHWIMHDDEFYGLTCECSNCHIETCGDTPFCPHCGRLMKKEAVK